MLSRVADTIYWLGRYMERTNGMLQVIRTHYISSQDDVSGFNWKPWLYLYGDLKSEEIGNIETNSQQVLEYMILDHDNRASAFNNIMQSRENARSIQDHITKEVWQCLNDYYHFIRDPYVEQQIKTGDPVSAIDSLIRNGLLFIGTVDNTMTRGEGFTYMHIGRFLERAVQTTDILRIKLNEIFDYSQPAEGPALRYLLYSLFGYEIYLKTYKGHFTVDNALDLIIHNTYFPHSVLYCLQVLNKNIERLKPESLPENYEQLEFLIGKTVNNIKYSNVVANQVDELNSFLLQTRNDLFRIATSFSQYYFGNT